MTYLRNSNGLSSHTDFVKSEGALPKEEIEEKRYVPGNSYPKKRIISATLENYF